MLKEVTKQSVGTLELDYKLDVRNSIIKSQHTLEWCKDVAEVHFKPKKDSF